MTEQNRRTTRVTRSVDEDEHIIAGVCSGLGRYFGINTWWFRFAFIVLALFGFAGIFFYIVAWVLIPKETEDHSVATRLIEGLDFTDVGAIFGIVLIGVAGVIILNQVFHVSGALVAAGVLAVVGVLLYRGDLNPPDIPREGGPHYVHEDESPPGVEPVPNYADAPTDATTQTGSPSVGASVASAVATTPPKPKKEKVRKPRPPKSMLGRLTMAVTLIALSSMVLIDLAGWAYFQPVEYLAGSMGIIALGLLVGAWIGRARWLIPIGILLAPLLLFASLLPSVSEWTFGDPDYVLTSVEQVQDSYSLVGGQLTIDLSGFTAAELAEVGRIEASVLAGNLFVILPLGVGAIVNTDIGAGSVDVGVEYHEVYGVPPLDVIEEFEACLDRGPGRHECEDRYLDGGFSDIEYGSVEWHSFSGIGISRSFDLGVAPHDFVLDLRVGVGGINIKQLGVYTVNDQDEG